MVETGVSSPFLNGVQPGLFEQFTRFSELFVLATKIWDIRGFEERVSLGKITPPESAVLRFQLPLPRAMATQCRFMGNGKRQRWLVVCVSLMLRQAWEQGSLGLTKPNEETQGAHELCSDFNALSISLERWATNVFNNFALDFEPEKKILNGLFEGELGQVFHSRAHCSKRTFNGRLNLCGSKKRANIPFLSNPTNWGHGDGPDFENSAGCFDGGCTLEDLSASITNEGTEDMGHETSSLSTGFCLGRGSNESGSTSRSKRWKQDAKRRLTWVWGFEREFRELIFSCIGSVNYKVCINGNIVGNIDPNMSSDMKRKVKELLNLKELKDGALYLGNALVMGRNRSKEFMMVKERLQNRLVGWQSQLLSRAGKAILIRTVTQAIPIYTMSTFLVLTGVCRQMDSIVKRFWWSTKLGAKRFLALKSWSSICKPKSARGLGFKKFEDINKALIAKLGWFIAKDRDCLWVKLLKSSIDVWMDPWVLDLESKVPKKWDGAPDAAVCKVAERWKEILIKEILYSQSTDAILQLERPRSLCEDSFLWTGSGNGIFIVKCCPPSKPFGTVSKALAFGSKWGLRLEDINCTNIEELLTWCLNPPTLDRIGTDPNSLSLVFCSLLYVICGSRNEKLFQKDSCVVVLVRRLIVNTEAAVKGSKSAATLVVRNAYGNVILAAAKGMISYSVELAEIKALSWAFEVALGLLLLWYLARHKAYAMIGLNVDLTDKDLFHFT
ncbi:hypothetical protein FEM48_Zijuj02G0101100 [Ziziphus jujuba var. spinosa]|uniref:Uncharacterized protein n=1 Tax=Ziziphus jujuba var. spinosa TaxID=714518 RepID=A0A978VV47_ZIZJJ|nr:hypothetical protein FEM48_Zijuj02G0101100 [Ziziphus jujuba var. spinosa]